MRIYFDHNASTPVDPAVVDVMTRALREDFGNASSVHHFGQRAKAILDDARSTVAGLIGAEPSEIVFTSGGTEADNFALRGVAEALEATGRRHLIATAIEHEAGLGEAARLARAKLAAESARLAALRDRLESGVLAAVPRTAVNGARDPRVPNTTNISFEGIEAESLLIALDLEGVAVSTGSACSSGTLEPSHVLRAMGLPSPPTQNSIRVSLGARDTDDEVDYFLEKLPKVVEKLRLVTGVRR